MRLVFNQPESTSPHWIPVAPRAGSAPPELNNLAQVTLVLPSAHKRRLATSSVNTAIQNMFILWSPEVGRLPEFYQSRGDRRFLPEEQLLY